MSIMRLNMGEITRVFKKYHRICVYVSLSLSLFWGRSVGFVVPPGSRVLQGVVVAILGFAELVKEKDDSLKAKD